MMSFIMGATFRSCGAGNVGLTQSAVLLAHPRPSAPLQKHPRSAQLRRMPSAEHLQSGRKSFVLQMVDVKFTAD